MALIRGEQITGSVASASLAVSASYSTNALSSSFALTASYVQTAQTASYVLNAVSSSFATSASHASTAVSSSYASTASYAGDYTLLSEFRQFTSSYESASASFDSRITSNSASIALLSASYNTGSFTGSFTGSLLGTASWASNAISSSYALSSSYAVSSSYALSASYAFNATTASYAHTASYVNPLYQNVIITGSIYLPDNAHSIYFSGSEAASRLLWNNEDGTLELGLKGGVVKSELGQGLVTRVVNKTVPSVDLSGSNYQAVIVSGAQGQRLAVKLAQADNDANSAGTLGIVAENIAKNEEGFIITIGLLKNRNTTGALQGETWSDGDILYLSPTIAGQITNIKPQAPQHTVIVGYVEYAHANNGKIYVKIDNGYEIDELHNVRITTGSLDNGQLLVRSGSVWINTKQLTGSYGITGSLSISGSTQVFGSSEFDGPTVVSGSLTVIGSSIFYGSASFVYVTASQLALSSSFISVNVFEPLERFGGIKVYDSGSSNATASLAWDSLHNHWVYQNVSGSTYTGGMLLSGPRNSGSLGDEPNLTTWFVPRSDGGDHLDNSQIFSSGSITIVTGSLTATQGITGSFTGSYIGDGAGLYNIPSSGIVGLNLSQIQSGSVSASISPVDGLQINTNVTATSFSGSFSGSGADLSNIPAAAIVGLNLSQIQSGSVSASISPNLGLQINTSVTATSFTGSLFGTASWANNAITASYILNAVSSSFATTASFAQTSSYAFNAVTSSYALTASYIDGGFY